MAVESGLRVRLEAETAQFHARMAAAEAQITRMSRAPAAAARGMTMMQTGMQALAAQAIGLTGPLGLAARGVGMFAIGGPLMLAVTAGLGAGALAAEAFSKDVEDSSGRVVTHATAVARAFDRIAASAHQNRPRLVELRDELDRVNKTLELAREQRVSPVHGLLPTANDPLSPAGIKATNDGLAERARLQHEIALEQDRQALALEKITGLQDTALLGLIQQEAELRAQVNNTNQSLEKRLRAMERLEVVVDRLGPNMLLLGGRVDVPEVSIPRIPLPALPTFGGMSDEARQGLRRALAGSADEMGAQILNEMFPQKDEFLKLGQAMKLAGIGAGEMEAAVLTGFGNMVEGVIGQTQRLEVLVVAGFFQMAERILMAERALAIQRAAIAASQAAAGGASSSASAAAGAAAGGALATGAGALAIAGIAIVGGIVSSLLGRRGAAPAPVRIAQVDSQAASAIAQATQVPPQPVYIFRGENVEEAVTAIRGQDRRDRSTRIPRDERPWMFSR